MGYRESGEYCRKATVSESTTVTCTEQQLHSFAVNLRLSTSDTTANGTSVTQGQIGCCVLHTKSVTSSHGAHLNVSCPVVMKTRPFLCPLAQNSCVFDKVLSIHLVPNSWKCYKPFGSRCLRIDGRTDRRYSLEVNCWSALYIEG